MTSAQKATVAAAAATVANIAVAITINLLTSGWSWLIFVVLAVLSGAWVGLEIWRSTPRRRPRAPQGPPAVPAVTGTFVPRPELTNRIVSALLDGKKRKVGITTGLAGAGGFGKTTIAREVFGLPEITAAFPTRHWVTVGQEVGGAALADTINDIIERIRKQPSGITSPEQAGLELAELLEEAGPSLLIVDDVWTTEQLRPFLNAGGGCTLLVTTRIPNLLSDFTDTPPVLVDQMSHAQARQLVTDRVTGLPESVSEQLLDIIGRWPIALGLANAALRRTAREGGDIAESAARLLNRLRESGPTALDVSDAARLERTVAATLESSLAVIGPRRDQVLELAIFPEDTEVPMRLVVLLWQTTAGLSEDESEQLCRELEELSLVFRHRDTLRLHDVIRNYLRHECGTPRLEQLHATLLDAVASTLANAGEGPVPWWNLPLADEYLWRSLAYHLGNAGRTEEVVELVTAPRWVIGKLRRFGPVAVAEDLAVVDTGKSLELTRFIDQLGHLLVPGTPDHAVVNALAQRLPDTPELAGLRQAALDEVEGMPRLVPERTLPDLPDLALNRVLEGHEQSFRGCVFAHDGRWVVSAGYRGLHVWHPLTGQLLRLVEAYFPDVLTLSPDGRFLSCESETGNLRTWDTNTWETYLTFNAHKGYVYACCYSLDGRVLVTAGDDSRIRVWDSQTGEQLREFTTPEVIVSCVCMPDGRLLSVDGVNLRLWDLHTGDRTDLPLPGRVRPRSLAVSPDHRWAAAATEVGLVVHDLTSPNEPPRTLHHHEHLSATAFSPRGGILATGTEKGLVVLWDTAEWRPYGQIAAHSSEIDDLAFSPSGTILASSSDDGTVRLWDPAQARAEIVDDRPGNALDMCVADPQGAWLAVSDGDSITVHESATGRTIEEIGHIDRVDRLAPVDGLGLAVEMVHEVMICHTANWQMSHTLSHPTGATIRRLRAGGDLVCVIDDENRVVVWDVADWQPPTFLTVDETGVHARHRTPRTPSKAMKRVDRLRKRFRKQSVDINLVIAPRAEWLAVSTGETIHVIEPRTWRNVATLRFPNGNDGWAAAPNGRWLAVRVDNTIQYWSCETWTLDATFTDHRGTASARDGAWSPDGALLATVSDDRTLRIHDAVDWSTRTEIRLDGELNGCTWLTNDRLVAVGGHGVYWFTYVNGVRRQDAPDATQARGRRPHR